MYAWFHGLRINLGIVIPRSEDILRLILQITFGVSSTFSIAGITILRIAQQSL